MGCLSHCGFSSWKDHDDLHHRPPRRSAQLLHPEDPAGHRPRRAVDENLMFAGHAAYRFKQDPFYSNNFTPTVKQLVDRILTGIELAAPRRHAAGAGLEATSLKRVQRPAVTAMAWSCPRIRHWRPSAADYLPWTRCADASRQAECCSSPRTLSNMRGGIAGAEWLPGHLAGDYRRSAEWRRISRRFLVARDTASRADSDPSDAAFDDPAIPSTADAVGR